MLFSICSQTENVQDPRVSLVNLWGRVRTLRGLFMVSRTGDDHPVCRFKKTPPCVDSKRPRVCRHHAHMLRSQLFCVKKKLLRFMQRTLCCFRAVVLLLLASCVFLLFSCRVLAGFSVFSY